MSVTHHISLKVEVVSEDSQRPAMGTGDASLKAAACMLHAVLLLVLLLLLVLCVASGS